MVFVTQALMQHAEPHLPHALRKILVIRREPGSRRTRVPDRPYLGNDRTGQALPRCLIHRATATHQASVLGHAHVLAHRRPAVPQRRRDATDGARGATGFPLHQNLFDVCHSHAPPRHGDPPLGKHRRPARAQGRRWQINVNRRLVNSDEQN